MEDRRKVMSWALYDWANSAFAITVMSAFFPLFLKQYWSDGADATLTTFRLGLANSIGSIVIALLSPILGAIADQGGTRKRYLIFFATMAIVMTGALPLAERGDWPLAIALYVLAVIGFSGSNSFYDALLVSVASEPQLDRVSSLGFALGYLGGGLLFALNVAMVLWPARFGLVDASESKRLSFGMAAVLWANFSAPLLVLVQEPDAAGRPSGRAAAWAGGRPLGTTVLGICPLWVVPLLLLLGPLS